MKRVLDIACLIFGAWIAVTSAIGAALGVQSFNGWLAISYGALGVSMGAAGLVATFTCRHDPVQLPDVGLAVGSGRAGLHADLSWGVAKQSRSFPPAR
ncbi:MAG TPA: hypothetical protein VJP81_01135 [Candidatus Dormibacteraeota bacterium]|nr:hypothetical protein [Candidatus Dormibacteraeota bacterium]